MKMDIVENNNANMAIQGTTAAVMTSYFYEAYWAMLPWFVAAVPLILIDLRLGRRKAKARGERVTIGRSIKMTIDKTFSYICWIMLATTLSSAFQMESLKYIIMAAIYGLEVISSIDSWYVARGVDIDMGEALRLVFKTIWNRIIGSNEEFHNVFKEKDDEQKFQS